MIRRIKNSLTLKVFLITSMLLIIICLLTFIFIACFMPKTFSAELSRDLERNAIKLTEQLASTKLEDSGELFNRFVVKNNADVVILDAQEKVVDIPGHASSWAEDIEIQKYGKGRADQSTGTDTSDYYFNAPVITTDDMSLGDASYVSVATSQSYPFSFAGSNAPYTLVVLASMQPVNQAAQALVRILPLLVVAILLMSFLGSWLYSLYVTRPIVNISRISKRMSEMEFHWRCKEKRSDEVGVLATSLNNLAEKLSAALDELKTANASLQADIDLKRELERKRLDFFAAVSHELKTPITVVKGQLEGMINNVGAYRDHGKYLGRSLKVTDRMEGLVQELLTVSRMESPNFALRLKRLDLGALASHCLSAHQDLFTLKNLSVSTEIEENLFVEGDEMLLLRALSNLISNAAHYSPEGSSIFVKAHRCDKVVCFTIENTGVHIPDEAISRLFNAFYRVEQSRNRGTGGSGLGLYIVKMILDLHKAEYRIENTAAGVQFTFALT